MKVVFVTGRLAEPALRNVLDDLAPRLQIDFEVLVLPISVAALMTPKWVERHLEPLPGVDRLILPGHCRGDLAAIDRKTGVPVSLGPEDLRDLPEFFGAESRKNQGYGAFDIEILAEINHAPRLPPDALIRLADHFREQGADLVDLGCDPAEPWPQVGRAVETLKNRGFRVSIDSFNPLEVAAAAAAGAELVLSVNGSNVEHAPSWGVEVVVIPDQPGTLIGLDQTTRFLRDHGVPYRIDPVLDPIGFGFAASLGRFLEVRATYPDAPIMMGVGNLTELTDVDSAGVNTLLIGFCQELGVRSVLTTEVINWARSSVREIDLARRLMHHAITTRTLPKNVNPSLVALRDVKLKRYGPETLAEMASRIKDHNWRIFAEDGMIIAMNGRQMLSDPDPNVLFDQMGVTEPSHAFYLGYEMMKAKTSLTLGKQYRQDQALDWGFLTEPEVSHQERKRSQRGGSLP